MNGNAERGVKKMTRRIVSVEFIALAESNYNRGTNIVWKNKDEDGDEFVNKDDEDTYNIERAVKKTYGKRCFWHPDSGLGLFYGQVFETLKHGNSSRTGKTRIDIAE
jgi:hypothetical protein